MYRDSKTRTVTLLENAYTEWIKFRIGIRIGSDRIGLVSSLLVRIIILRKSFRAACVSNKKIDSHVLPALKFTAWEWSQRIIFAWTALGNFLLHNFMRLQFQNEAWSCDISRIEEGGERCKCLSLYPFCFTTLYILVFFLTEPILKVSFQRRRLRKSRNWARLDSADLLSLS